MIQRGGRSRSSAAALALAVAVGLASPAARAQVVGAEPRTPIEARFPPGAPPIEVQVTLQLVVDTGGHVESAVVASRLPLEAPSSFDAAALDAAGKAAFTPTTREGRAIRSRVEYVVVFHPPPELVAAAAAASATSASWTPASTRAPSPSAPPATAAPTSGPVSTTEQDEDYAQVVQVRGAGWPSPRGLGDVRIKRELLEASPRQQASEMLSAAPGFFVDHEDGEGFGNDVYLRGFDLDHGSGIEMRVGNVPVNVPTHIQGQGYADANFIVPEVVRSVRVLEGPYDPRQGDAAIVGSAYFDLGVENRGYQFKTSYGSFNQVRVLGVAAPDEADDETFAAFALRRTDGFGRDRAAQSGTVNAQYGFDVGARDHVRLLAMAYTTRATLPGVVREDDVDAGRIAYDGTYPSSQGQGVQSSRVLVGADFDHVTAGGARFEIAPWVMGTDFRARQNFSGNILSSQIDPHYAGLGDLWETTNVETAVGVTSRFLAAPTHPTSWLDVAAEPGVTFRAGHTEQTRSLLEPDTLQAWDRRVDDGLNTIDAAGYLDLDLRLWKKLRVSGGIRGDLLAVSVDDRLANVSPAGTAPAGALAGARRSVQGLAASPRVTAEYDLTRELAPVFSYGEGFRSLDASANAGVQAGLQEGSSPYSKVRSVEAGLRAQTRDPRYTATVAAFETWVADEVVFEAASGGLTTEGASLRRGVVSSVVAKPLDWLLVSTALSVTRATYQTLGADLSQYVPDVPPILFRADVTARGKLGEVALHPLTGRVGLGYTFLSGRHLTDTLIGPASHVLNASGALRYRGVELGVEGYNILGLHYADDEQVFVSNWSLGKATALASTATHLIAAPPTTIVGTLALSF